MIVLHPGIERPIARTVEGGGGRLAADLTGATLGVVNNHKYAFVQFADLVAEKLKEQAGVTGYIRVDKTNLAETVADDVLAPLVERAHFAVTGLGD